MYSEERIRKGAEKLEKGVAAKQQGRLDGFFKAQPKAETKKDDDKKPAKGKGKGKADTKGTKRKVSLLVVFRCNVSVDSGCDRATRRMRGVVRRLRPRNRPLYAPQSRLYGSLVSHISSI